MYNLFKRGAIHAVLIDKALVLMFANSDDVELFNDKARQVERALSLVLYKRRAQGVFVCITLAPG